MKYLLKLAMLCALLVPVTGCGIDVELGLGTITLKSKAVVDEWAQANVLKALDTLVESAAKKEDAIKEVPDGDSVPE